MRGMTISEVVATTFTTEDCIECGVEFALPEKFVKQRQASHKTFYCPNGHGQIYPAQTEAERLKRELDVARDALAASRAREAEEVKRHAATRGQLTKTRNRLSNGVCPDCNRHFVNVERHMKNKHAEQSHGV